MNSTFIRLGILFLMISLLAGCTGNDGAAGPAGPAGTGVGLMNVSNMTAEQWQTLKPTIDPASISITIASNPVVKFKVTDINGNPLIGLGTKGTTNLNNMWFTLAKLVPVVGGPSKWVTYLVTSSSDGGVTWTGNFPQRDREGTMVDHGDGTYQYTFFRDITKAKDIVAALPDNAAAYKYTSDLNPAELNFDPTATHRLGIVISGNQPGSSTAVALATPTNVTKDFRPDGGTVTITRTIVQRSSCDECHSGKVIGHSDRRDPNLCVTCHTDQIKYSFDDKLTNSGEATSTSNGYVLTGTTRPTTAIVDGRALGNFPNLIHKMHMGEELVKTGYNFNAAEEGMFNDKKYPQSPSNCTKCHDGSATAVNKTADGDNWKMVPSRLACGACHDGINFATGNGATLADRDADVAAANPVGTTQSGHGGGFLTDDSTCSSGGCHDAANNAVVHESTVPTPHNPVVKAGVATIEYDLKSVTINSSNQPVVTFQIKKDGVAVTSFNTTTASPVPSSFEAITGLTRGPTFYVAYAVAQDGIASPADFNGRVGASLSNLLTSGAANAGTITGPDGSGYFTATLTGPATAPITIPASAKMVTGLMVGRFEQVVNSVTVKIKPVLKTVVASGYTGRRVIVAAAKCNNCHEQLGTSPEFHNGERNDPTACAICHTPNEINDGKSATINYGWAGASNTYIHGIHAAGKRSVPFTWAAWDFTATDNVSQIVYPGILKNCEQCHLPNTVNFGTSGPAIAPNMLYTTTSAGLTVDAATTFGVSPYIVQTAGTDYGLPASVDVAGVLTPAASTTLVNSPMASACFSCHDTDLAKAHMTSNGGSIYEVRTTALAKTETCLVCHGVGRIADVAVVHQ